MLRVQTPMIPLIGEMIARRPGTISLGQGMVHYGPPEAALTAAAEAARAGPEVDRYGAAFGIKPLVDAIAAKAQTENGASLDGRQIVVTAGSNMGFLTAILAIADPGDEVILLAPYYFNHEMAIEIAGCRTVAVATDNQYQPDLPAIEAAVTPRTRAVVTVSPNNPTGISTPRPPSGRSTTSAGARTSTTSPTRPTNTLPTPAASTSPRCRSQAAPGTRSLFSRSPSRTAWPGGASAIW